METGTVYMPVRFVTARATVSQDVKMKMAMEKMIVDVSMKNETYYTYT